MLAAQGAPDEALLALQQALPRLEALHADAAAVQSLWLTCIAAAALSEQQDAGDVLVSYTARATHRAAFNGCIYLCLVTRCHHGCLTAFVSHNLIVATHRSASLLWCAKTSCLPCSGLLESGELAVTPVLIEFGVRSVQAQALMLLRDWDAAPDARFAARIQAVLAAGELRRDGAHKV